MDDERRNTERLRYLLERWLFHFIDHLEVGDEVGNYLAKETRLVLYGIADESRDATR